MALSDAELTVLVSATKDAAAFGELVQRHQTAVRGLLRRLTGDVARADDLAQDAFIRAFERIGDFSGAGSFRAWLCRIAYREFLQSERRRRLIGRVTELFGREKEAALPPPEQARDLPDMGLAVRAALARLAPKERDALVLCDACGFSHTEAAEIMGLPLGTVKSHVRRGREKVRSILEPPAHAPESGSHKGRESPGV